MPRKKKEIQEEIVSEIPALVVAEESEAKKQFRAMIETYKENNPVKYELKRKGFEEQLNKL